MHGPVVMRVDEQANRRFARVAWRGRADSSGAGDEPLKAPAGSAPPNASGAGSPSRPAAVRRLERIARAPRLCRLGSPRGRPGLPDQRGVDRHRRGDRAARRRGRLPGRPRARSVDKLEALARELGGEGRRSRIRCDVTEWEDQEALVDARARPRSAGSTSLFANAGFGAKRGFLEETPELWQSMVLTNVLGVALTIRATLPSREGVDGHYLLTSSVAGRRALAGLALLGDQVGRDRDGRGARQELNGTGVRVTLIEPGRVDTPFFDDPVSGALEPDDIARAILFAVSQPEHDGRERAPRPPDGAGQLAASLLRHGSVSPHARLSALRSTMGDGRTVRGPSRCRDGRLSGGLPPDDADGERHLWRTPRAVPPSRNAQQCAWAQIRPAGRRSDYRSAAICARRRRRCPRSFGTS